MKKFTAMLLLITVVFSMSLVPAVSAEDAVETVTDTIYAENFDTGVFTLVTNEAGTVKDVYKDGVKTPLTYAKLNDKAFADTFPETITATSEYPNSNTTTVLTTGSYAYGGTAVDGLFINFPKIDNGVVTIKFSVVRSSASGDKIWMIPLSDSLNDDLTVSDYVYYTELFRSSSTTRFRQNVYAYTDTSTRTAAKYKDVSGVAKEFIDYTLTIDVDNQTTKCVVDQYNKDAFTLDNDLKWYANGDAGSYYMADGVGGMFFTSNDVLNLDDIEITHTHAVSEEPETSVAEIENLTINKTGTISSSATFNYLGTDSQPKTARLVTAVYDEDDNMLLAVKTSTSATVSADSKTATLSTDPIAIPDGAVKVKAFVWDLETLKPYAVTEASITQ